MGFGIFFAQGCLGTSGSWLVVLWREEFTGSHKALADVEVVHEVILNYGRGELSNNRIVSFWEKITIQFF